MGVYVKDLAMPSNCMECMKSGLRSAIKCTEWKYLSAGLFESWRANTCPLVEVPEKHGRLIDADEIYFSMTNSTDQDIAEEAIRETQTVIEAEDE